VDIHRAKERTIKRCQTDLISFVIIEASKIWLTLVGTPISFGTVGVGARVSCLSGTNTIGSNIVGLLVPVTVFIATPALLWIAIISACAECELTGTVIL